MDESSPRSRALWVLSCVVVVLVVITAVVGLTVPIYQDEPDWWMKTGRLLRDNFTSVNSWAQCTGFVTRMPVVLVPAAFVNGLISHVLVSPFQLRAMGVASYVAWSAGLVWATRRWLGGRWVTTAATVLSVTSLGVLPFLLVLSRPEQSVLAAVSVVVAAALVVPPKAFDKFPTLGALGVFLAFTMALERHPKAAIFLPVFVVAGVACTRGIVRRVLVIAASVLSVFATKHWWDQRLYCPEDPRLQSMLEGQMVSVGDIVKHPWPATKQIAQTFGEAKTYLDTSLFADDYTSSWLPSGPSAGTPHAINAAIIIVWSVAVAWCVAGFAIACRKDFAARKLSLSTAMAGALGLSLLAESALQAAKFMYNSSLMLPLVLVLAVVTAKEVIAHIGAPIRGAGQAMLLVTALASMGQLLWFANDWVPKWRTPGIVPNQGGSTSVFGWSAEQRRIMQAASACNISPVTSNHHMVVDNVTLYAFWQGGFTMNSACIVNSPWSANSELKRIMSQYHSSGAVVQCSQIPGDLRAEARQTGAFCCLPAAP